jgi:hypothetical protein
MLDPSVRQQVNTCPEPFTAGTVSGHDQRMLRATLAALALALTGTATAQAAPAPNTYVPAAIQWWGQGQAPACGQPIFQMVARMPDISEFGDATFETCVIRLDRTAWQEFTPNDRCRALFHEMGHLYGFGHTRSGIMAEDLYGGPFAVCDKLTAVKAKASKRPTFDTNS